MTGFRLGIAGMVALAAIVVPAAADRSQTGSTPLDRYQIIEDRNIFSKERGQPARTGRFSSILRPEAPPPSPEESTILTGIVRHGDAYVAFFEDRRSGATRRVRQGQSLFGGTIGTITLDLVEYIKGGQVSRVAIGETLAKGPSGPAPAETIAAPPAASRATSIADQPATAPVDEASILEMLKKRRQQEMGNN